jgi:phosphoribosylformylglycinamidine synthase
MGYSVPFISGKDSLNNEFVCEDGSVIAIPATLLISAISLVDDVNKCVTMDIKRSGNYLFVVGMTKNELGGSHYYKVNGQLGANVPTVDVKLASQLANKVAEAIQAGLIVSCHDCSEGGLAVALAEMAFAGGLGIEADLGGLPVTGDAAKADAKLFSESNSRYIVEVEPDKYDAFARMMLNLPFGNIGSVTDSGRVVISSKPGERIIDMDINTLKNAWQKPLKW